MTQGGNSKSNSNWWTAASQNRSWLSLAKASPATNATSPATSGAKIGERRAKS